MIAIRISAIEAAILQRALVRELRACQEEGGAIDALFDKLKMEDWPYPGRKYVEPPERQEE